MFMEYIINYHKGIFEVTTSGNPTLQGFSELIKSLLEHEDWKPGGKILLNHTRLKIGSLSMRDVEAIASISGQMREQFGKVKIASIVAEDMNYGMVEAWQSMVRVYEGWDVSEELFKNKENAVEWLKNG